MRHQPEALARDIGPAADVYSLGAILYAILTGQPPYSAATAAEALQRVRDGLVWQPRMIAGRIPSSLEGVCLTAMERDPDGRYSSPAELAREIERRMAGERVRTNYAEPTRERLRRFGPLILIGLLLASLIGLGRAMYVIHVERQYTHDDAQQAIEKFKEAATKINGERTAASVEFEAATQTLHDLALMTGRANGDQTLSSFKQEVRLRINIAAGGMAKISPQEGTHLAAAHYCMSLARLLQALGRFDEARQQYQQAVRITQAVANAEPEDAEAKRGLFLAAPVAQVQLGLAMPSSRQSRAWPWTPPSRTTPASGAMWPSASRSSRPPARRCTIGRRRERRPISG